MPPAYISGLVEFWLVAVYITGTHSICFVFFNHLVASAIFVWMSDHFIVDWTNLH